MLKATRKDHYISKKKNLTFRYIVEGTQQELETYKEAQGIHYVEFNDLNNDKNPLNGKPLFFTTQPLEKEIKLTITQGGKVIPYEDTDDMAMKVLHEEQLITVELAKLKANERFNRSRVTTSA